MTTQTLAGEKTNGTNLLEETSDLVGKNLPDVNADDIVAMIDAKMAAALEEAMSTPKSEIAEPLYWWDLFAIGPIQPGAHLAGSFTGPLLPHQVIRVGEVAYVATVIRLNPFFPAFPPSAAEVLSSFALPYEVEYGTGELKHWKPGPAYLQHVSHNYLVPGKYWAIDVFRFRPEDEGLYEMNICARIFGCHKNAAPPFSGYATVVVDIDRQMFGPGPRVQYDQSIRFQVYK